MENIADIAGKAGLRRVEYLGYCEEHGPFTGKHIYLHGNLVSDSGCPECAERARIQKEADQLAAAKAEAERLEQEKKRLLLEQALHRSAIPDEYRDKSFENFVATTANQRGALDLSLRFVRGWDKAKTGGFGLLFYGKPGTGKSHLACAILHALLGQTEGFYTRVHDISNHVRSTFGKRPTADTREVESFYADMPLLVIDEVGVQSGTDFEKQTLFSIIDTRLSCCRPTIFLTNLAPVDMVPVLGERLVDRIKGKSVVYQFEGASMRKPITADVFGEAA